MSAFVLKIIALIAMTCDHISYLVYGHFSNLNYIGRLAFPIFAFQISEGYKHTSNLKKYFLRLLVFAIISQIPFMLFYSMLSSSSHLNIFFTLLLGLLSITIYDKLNNLNYSSSAQHYLYRLLGIIFAIILSIIAEVISCDYGAFGVLSVFIFFLFKDNKIAMNIAFIFLTIIHYLKNLLSSLAINNYTYLFIIIFTCLSLIFINLYNGQKGKKIKYLLYFFYPIHLLVIYTIHLLTIL